MLFGGTNAMQCLGVGRQARNDEAPLVFGKMPKGRSDLILAKAVDCRECRFSQIGRAHV